MLLKGNDLAPENKQYILKRIKDNRYVSDKIIKKYEEQEGCEAALQEKKRKSVTVQCVFS